MVGLYLRLRKLTTKYLKMGLVEVKSVTADSGVLSGATGTIKLTIPIKSRNIG